MENYREIAQIFEKSKVNLDKMFFKYINETEIPNLLVKQDLNLKTEQVVGLIEKISGDYEGIKKEIQNRLSTLIPDYNFKEFKVIFTLDRKSDFRAINNDEIIVDLGRLLRNLFPEETLIEGITHEVFHIWFNRQKISDVSKANYNIIDNNKADILLKSLNEGYAVKVSNQSLEKLYREPLSLDRGVRLSFDKFNKFLNFTNQKEIEDAKKEGFETMGFFYIVGYEMINAIISHQNIDIVKNALANLDFFTIIEKYEDICKTDSNLPKIDFESYKKIINRK